MGRGWEVDGTWKYTSTVIFPFRHCLTYSSRQISQASPENVKIINIPGFTLSQKRIFRSSHSCVALSRAR